MNICNVLRLLNHKTLHLHEFRFIFLLLGCGTVFNFFILNIKDDIMEHWIPVLWVVVAISLLLFLTIKVKLHSMFALLLVAIFLAFAQGMGSDSLLTAITNGAGHTLGSVGLIVVLGAILGQLMTDCGASKKIADTVVQKCDVKYLQWGLLVVGSIFGIAMFFEVAFMIIVPLIISIAKEAKIPYMALVIPAIAAAAQAHSLFPPQPGPMALVHAFNVDVGSVYLLGIVVLVPSIIAAGIVLPRFLKDIDTYPEPNLSSLPTKESVNYRLPSFGVCILIPLIPAVLMIGHTLLEPFVTKGSLFEKALIFLGSPTISLLIAILVALYVFGIRAGRTIEEASNSVTSAIKGIAVVVLIIAAGGIFKEVIISAGVGQHIAAALTGVSISPLILAWFIAATLRWATGQGAVSAITAAGIVAPLIPVFNVDPTLLLLATAAGSNTITLPNDASFWLMKETFNLSISQTFKTWGLFELVNSVVGLLIVLLLSLFI